MKGDYLGAFEELVLLAVASVGDDAYGVSVQERVERDAERPVSLGAVYAALDRLQRKSYVTSWIGDAGNTAAAGASATSRSRRKAARSSATCAASATGCGDRSAPQPAGAHHERAPTSGIPRKRIILRLLCPRESREDIEGDLLELYARREAAGGAHDAKTRLRRDLLSLCLVLVLIRLRAIGSVLQSAIDGRWVSGVAQDVRYGSRVMRRQPAFSVAVVLTLAIGIGANAAIFSVVHAVLFKDLPYEAGDRFVAVRQVISMPGPFTLGFSAPHYVELATRQTALERIAAVTFNETTLTGQGEPEKLQTGFVSSGFFPLLGVRSQMGRSFRSGEYRGRPQRRGAHQPRPLAAALRRRPWRPLEIDGLVRTPGGDRRRASRGLQLHRPRGCLGSARVHP